MTVFDELLNLLKPDRLLKDARATGEGVAVAVVDSGIDRALLEEKHRAPRITGALFRGAKPEVLPDTGQPSSPHGSTVADIILTIAPRATLTPNQFVSVEAVADQSYRALRS